MMLPRPLQLKKRRAALAANDADDPTSEHVVILADDAPAAVAEPGQLPRAELAPAEVTAPAARSSACYSGSYNIRSSCAIGSCLLPGSSSQYTCSLGDCN